MSITKRDLIKNKYTQFSDFLKQNDFADELSLFPSLDDIDVADLTYFLTLTFIGITEEKQFKDKIQVLAELNSVKLSNEKLNVLSVLVKDFMIWMRTL